MYIKTGIIITFLLVALFGIKTVQVQAKDHAPKLLPMYPSTLVWKWHHKNPYHWNVYQSLDNGATYFLIEDYWAWGNARQFAPDGGSELMFVVGVDQSGKEITGRSNVVRPDDAPVPRKKYVKK